MPVPAGTSSRRGVGSLSDFGRVIGAFDLIRTEAAQSFVFDQLGYRGIAAKVERCAAGFGVDAERLPAPNVHALFAPGPLSTVDVVRTPSDRARPLRLGNAARSIFASF